MQDGVTGFIRKVSCEYSLDLSLSPCRGMRFVFYIPLLIVGLKRMSIFVA